jgi:hypothetical protein
VEVAPEVRGYSIAEDLVGRESDPEAHIPDPVDRLGHRSLEAQEVLLRSGDSCVVEGETWRTPIMTRSPSSPL